MAVQAPSLSNYERLDLQTDLAKAERALAAQIHTKKDKICTVPTLRALPGHYLSGLRLWMVLTGSQRYHPSLQLTTRQAAHAQGGGHFRL